MNPTPQQFPPGDGFRFHGGFGPMQGRFHEGGPNALQWVTFALVLLLVLAYFGTLVSFWSSRRARMHHGGPPPWVGRRHFYRTWDEPAAPPPAPEAPTEESPPAA